MKPNPLITEDFSMRARLLGLAVGALVAVGAASSLAAQAPEGATAKCKDDTYSTSTSHRGACKGHGGVAEWLTTAKATKTKTEKKTKAESKTAASTETAAAPAGPPPANATAVCKDGSYSTSSSRRGACKGHGGVSEWLAKSEPKAKSKKEKTKPAESEAAAPAPAAAPAAAAAPARAPTVAKAPPGNAPADATALCKDGTYSHSQHHRGACSDHGGVQQWLKEVPE